MSLIVAIKNKDRIVLGSDKQSSVGVNKEHSCTKIWDIPELPGAIMGGVGVLRASQILQFNQILDKNDIDPEKFDTAYIVNAVVPTIVAILKNNGIDCTIKENEEQLFIPNTFILAYKDKAWTIWNDLSVTELQDYLVVGSGSDVATGVLFATPEKDPFKRIVTCIDAAAENTLFVDNGVDILATEYYEEDDKLFDNAINGDQLDPELINEFNQFLEAKSKKQSKTNNKPKQTKKKEK